jgi:hypothetical protein
VGGGCAAPKTRIPSACTRYWSGVCNTHSGGGDSMWNGLYTAVEVIGARDGENEWGVGVLPPKHGYQALDISPVCVKLTVEVVVVCGMG